MTSTEPLGAPVDSTAATAATARTAARPKAAVLAIDGGNSKTDVALVGADGTLLASVRGPGSCPQEVGLDRCLAILTELVTAAARKADLWAGAGQVADPVASPVAGPPVGPPAGPPAGPPVGPPAGPPPEPLVEHTAAYLAGADLPIEEAQLQRAVHARGWGRQTEVANDTFALLRAGTTSPSGVAVVCGAGINCVGVAPDGRVARFPSLGRISGDWGGGNYLGEEALWWAVRAEDGRGPRTALQETVPAHFGMIRVSDVMEAIHFRKVAERRIGELTPVLFATAAAGDPVARDLVNRLAEEVSVMALVALRRLDLLGTETDVVLGGGVLAAQNPLLMEGIAARLATDAPRAVIRVTSVPPVVGAALLGLDRYGLTPGTEQRLRHAFAAS